ncbi:anhydro-N-acetylmuramic acid kinase [Candidatus Pelagibacter sp.]|uniref:anhydro-N-acetylmuramic acid kinase n=1 Tax=Candidatus Pelagibacter sp. TaxID=2024849 RepID=UPI003F858462
MKKKLFNSLGIMSGTSMDGVDISLIKTDGENYFERILDEYHDFPNDLYEKLIRLRKIINSKEDIENHQVEIKETERNFTLFHAKIINKIISQNKIDIVGLHGQTIFHSPKNKISIQIGDGKLLSQLIKKKVIFNFRKNDIENNGQGAPLTPIFHNLIAKNNIKTLNANISLSFLNIGGISNMTKINKNFNPNLMEGFDLGPGNCLIDSWIKKNTHLKYDQDGKIASSGKINQLILNQVIDNFNSPNYLKSLDINDYEISFLRGLELEEGCRTITEITANLIANGINNLTKQNNDINLFILCGGGRKNKFLIKRIENYLVAEKNFVLKDIDEYNLDGDFIESQAFGFLAARSVLNLPISFPNTTRCQKAISGGEIIENF